MDDKISSHEEVQEINLNNVEDEEDLLDEMPEKEESQKAVRNDSGLETSDSMDAVKDDKEPPLLTPMIELVPLCSENADEVPSNVTVTMNALPELQPLPTTPCDSPEKSLNSSRRSSASTSFIDSLLNKIKRRNTFEGSGSEISPSKLEQAKSNDEEDLLEEMEAPITFTQSSNPNMLPTPVVKNPRAASAFVNSDEDFEIPLTSESSSETNTKMIFDKSKMSSKSQPPKMNAPNYSNIPRPRTLAEKRMLVSTNMDFLMIEQEAKIFKHIERKKKGEALNYNQVESMMNEDIPIKYGPWKALQWLRTQEGNYIQQYLKIDGESFRLCGSRGNHMNNKYLPPQSNMPHPKIKTIGLRSVRCCAGGKIKRREIDQLVTCESIKKFVLEESLEPYKRLESKNILTQLCSIRPRPLGKKIEFINQNRKLLNANEDSMFLGYFSKFQMPEIKLEVTVQNKVPLNAVAKQYLNELIPHRDLNENWINFALSPIKSEEANEEENKVVFEFTVPYHENKQHILVREVIKSKQDTEKLRILDTTDDDVDEMDWTFAANADKNDSLEMEIVDVIKDLTNSVFINLNDDLFTVNDPDERTVPVSLVKPKEVLEEIATSKSMDPKKDKRIKVLAELRRLNANVVKSDAAQVVDEEDIRRHATAHLGREERGLRATVIVTDSDTVLLGNSEKDIRRKKRLPKKFNDYLHSNAQNEDERDSEGPPLKKVKQDEYPVKIKTPPPEKCTSDDLKAIRQEVNKWLHVTVDVNRMEVLSQVQHWCMLHNAYKCACKNVGLTLTPEYKAYKRISTPNTANNSLNSSRANSLEKEDPKSLLEELPPRRVLPVEFKANKERQKRIEEPSESPQMEIINLTELINSGIGPIFINIYDTKENRLKPIFRSILNNKTALTYIDGFAYFIDTNRVDVKRLNFDKMREILEHAIFIIMPKSTFLTGNTSVSHDFVQLLFKRDSDVIQEIKDKKQLKEIADIIESILQNAKKKIELQVSDPSDRIREQLKMIRRDRLCSESTSSSANTSPLHFNGRELEKAPSPGPDSSVMQEFNRIFSVRMRRLCAMIKTNSLGLHPLESFVHKFYIYKWDLLLQAFESDIIHIWQVKVSADNDLIMAITDTNQPPVIENAESITNIRKLSMSNDTMTELTRLILLRVENVKTHYMTVMLFGHHGYFKVCGILNSKENFVDGFVAKPTRTTHPKLTAKIQKIYNLWYGLKKAKESNINEKEAKKSDVIVIDDKNDDVEIVEPIHKPRIIAPRTKSKLKPNFMLTPRVRVDIPKSKTPPLVENTLSTRDLLLLAKKQREEKKSAEPMKIKSMPKAEDKLNLCEKKWFLFNVTNDFSDIYIKQWGRYLPYETIMRAIRKSKELQKAVQLISSTIAETTWPRIYALPSAPLKFKDQQTMTSNFLIFGPYLRNVNSNLLLMQGDGDQKFLRDDYEKIHNIKRQVRTRCIWIYANTLKCITENKVEFMYFSWDPQKKTMPKRDEQEKTLKISSIVGGFKDKSIQNGSSG